MKRPDGLYIYFMSNKGYHYGPVKMRSIEDKEEMLYEHKNYDKYYIVETKNNSDTPVDFGIIDFEPSYTRRRKK